MAWSKTANIRGATGPAGSTGATGASGAAATVAVGTVTTGAVGSSASVTNSGSSSAAVLDFAIPRGATGATGSVGPAGTTTWSGITDKPAVIAAGVDAAAARNVISAENTANKGAANGYASLDSSGLVPSSQLPSFVDDVVEAANLASFPATGESGKIYTALDTNKVYRWGGSSYTEISPSPGSTDAVPEGSTNLYYTAARADGRITAAIGSSVQAYSATLTTYAGKSAPSGAVVGTTDTQALTNKDLSGTGNTFPTFNQNTTGSAATLTTGRTVQTNLASTSAATFNGSANIAPGVTGTLPVANGGTGVATITANGVVVGGGTGAVSTVAPGTSGNILTSNGTSWASTTPAFIQRSISTITSPTTLGSTAATDYVTFCSYASTDANAASTVALLHGDGANNSTTITDTSILAANWTANSGAKLSTAQKKFGTAAVLFSAANDYIYPSAATSNFVFGTGDFTIEMFVYLNSTAAVSMFYDSRNAGSTSGAYSTLYADTGGILYYWTGGANRITGPTLSTATWYHVAVSRSGTSTRLFVDGTQRGSTYTDSTNYDCPANRPRIGGEGNNATATTYLNGYVDEVRINKWFARYTANFTAPSAAFPDTTLGTPTLPTAASNTNMYRIKNINTFSITPATTSSQTIDGAAPAALSAGSTLAVISDGSNWRTI